MLLLTHLLQRMPVYEVADMAWAARQFDTSEQQLYMTLHRDNEINGWLWKLVSILERKGWPTINLVEYEKRIHYDPIEKSCYDVKVEWRVHGHLLEWVMTNE